MSKKNNNAKDKIAENLRSLRARANISQAELAAKLGISQQTYSKYENRSSNPDSEMIVKLSAFYGVSSDSILGIEPKTNEAAFKLGSYRDEKNERNVCNDAERCKSETGLSQEQLNEITKIVLSEIKNSLQIK